MGFFIPIPAERIEAAVRWMVDRYETLHHEDDNMVFKVFPTATDVKLRTFRGTNRALQGRALRIYIKDILPLCTFSLSLSLCKHPSSFR